MNGLISKISFIKISFLSFGNILYLFFSLAIVKALTNIYSTEEFGEYSIIIALSAITFIFIQTITSILGPFFKEGKFSEKIIVSQSLNILIFISIFFLIIITCISLTDYFFEVKYSDEIIFSILLGLGISVNMVLNTLIIIKGMIYRFIIFNNLPIVLKFIIAISLLILGVKISIISLIKLFVIANIITSLLSLVHYRAINKKDLLFFNFDKTFYIEYFNYTKYYIVLNLIGWSNNFFDKYFLGRIENTKLVGIYSLNYQYSFSILNQISQVIGQFFNSFYWKKNIIDENKKISSVLKVLFFLNFLFIGLIIFIPDELLDYFIILVSNLNYTGYYNVYKLIAISGVFFMTSQILSNPLFKKEKIKSLVINHGTTFIIFIITSFFLTLKLSILGLSIALLLSNFFLAISNVVSILKDLNENNH